MTWVVVVVTAALTISNVGYVQPAPQFCDVDGFCRKLPGDWVGTVSQSMDGKLVSIRYFHASAKLISPGVYETTFTYYRIDEKTGALVPAGESGMASKTDASGTVTNSMTGKGDILIDVDTWKPAKHELTEVLRVCPAGGLEGTATGCISVSGMPLGLGKNGKVRDYVSTWSVSDDALKISQRFSVVFRALIFSKSYVIKAEYTATRGSDVLALMKATQGAGPAR